MHTGETFRLRRSIIGIENSHGERVMATIPAGATIRVVNGPWSDDPRLVDVRWERRYFVVFADDLKSRGEEIPTDRGVRTIESSQRL